MTKGGKLNDGIFEGETINTPSMLCVEDYLDALDWAEVDRRSRRPLSRAPTPTPRCSRDWVARHAVDRASWPRAPTIRSNTSVCLEDRRPGGRRRSSLDAQAAFAKKLAGLLEKEGVAYDIGGYRDAPPGLRIWCGATVETADLEALTPWLDWAFAEAKAALPKAAVSAVRRPVSRSRGVRPGLCSRS